MSAGPVYLDASAIVKLVVAEAGTSEVIDFLRTRPTRVTCAVSPVEVRRAVVRRLGPSAARGSAFDGILVVDLTTTIVERAGDLEPDGLRTLDAIHLATALELRAELEAFMTYDRRLAEAARAVGLPVVAPGGAL
ncbi:MAG: type II toxin-antitoxin system VapC family toxin [Chloroflexi bacterium]|nr:type II toxin-antitoxin system VapC family toxin [Chloroflexota bacterium]